MKRRTIFGLAAGAAVTPMVLQPGQSVRISAEIPILKPSFQSVVVGFDEDQGYWWMRSQIGDWHDLTRCTALKVPSGWLDGMTRVADGVWQGDEVRPEVADRHARYLRSKDHA